MWYLDSLIPWLVILTPTFICLILLLSTTSHIETSRKQSATLKVKTVSKTEWENLPEVFFWSKPVVALLLFFFPSFPDVFGPRDQVVARSVCSKRVAPWLAQVDSEVSPDWKFINWEKYQRNMLEVMVDIKEPQLWLFEIFYRCLKDIAFLVPQLVQ